nr:mitochondrial proton/calcium exchanger protein-like [Tanacetum cinerariifolium]
MELDSLVVSVEEMMKNLQTVSNQLKKPDDNSVPTLENNLNASNSDISPALFTHPDNKTEQQEKMKRRLNARIEYANFLEDTVKEMTKEVQSRRTGEPQDLDHFLDKVRTGGGSVANDEILGFAKLFNDQLSLRNISRPRLVNMCKYMGIQLDGTDTYLRYMLHKRLQWIKNDDKRIQSKGGVDACSEDELGEDCRERGMLGIRSVEEMRQQLRDWLDLSLNHSVPSSLLILSRATLFSLPVDTVEYSVSERQRKLEKEEEAKKKHSVESNKDVALEEIINATAAYAQQQLCKVSEALAVLASASSLSREREEFLKLVNKEINLYHSMMDKEGTDGEHVLDGASSALINRVDAMLQKLEKDIDDVHAMIGDKRRVLDRIKNDDKMVQSKGGVDALSEDKLGEDCRERGMLGLRSVEEMRQQVISAFMLVTIVFVPIGLASLFASNHKKLVLSTSSWLVGKNNFIGIAYLAVGGLCFFLAIAFTIIYLVKPRRLGDPSYLSWNRNPGAAESSPREDEDHCPSVFEPTTSEERPIESVEDHFTPVVEACESSRCVVTPQDCTSIMGVEDGDEAVIMPKYHAQEVCTGTSK